MVIEHLFNSREALFDALTGYCRDTLNHAINSHGKAGFFVSGGSTPAPLYERLSHSDLAWQNVNVALVDERWVANDSDSSNERLIRNTLLTNNAADAHFIAMKNRASSAKEGLMQTTDAYLTMDSQWDLSILGMGNDGHTASIFPYCDGLPQAIDPQSSTLLSAIMAQKSAVTGDNLERMTLTLAGLMKSRHLVLLLTGQEKLDVFRQAQANQDLSLMPVSALLQQTKVPVHLYWAA